jgi:hypothetical protein
MEFTADIILNGQSLFLNERVHVISQHSSLDSSKLKEFILNITTIYYLYDCIYCHLEEILYDRLNYRHLVRHNVPYVYKIYIYIPSSVASLL